MGRRYSPLPSVPAAHANNCGDMKDAKRQKRRGRPEANPPDMRVVGIDFNPGPDAEDRLRRLFIILLKLADDELPQPGTGSPPDDGKGEEG